MKRLSALGWAIAVIAATTVAVQAQTKNVLLEQHTGAWCGWCPDGTVKMAEIQNLYGSRVIGVKIHTGDDMEIPEEETLADTLGLTGVPTATVNRKAFSGSVFLNRGTWKTACEAEIGQPAKAKVDCLYMLDRTARTVDVHVTVTILESMNLPLRFNAFIVEDDVTGTGAGYDQHNYLSGRAGYENNLYYSQPAVLVGYHHMKVVRRMLGGAWGVAGALPASVKAGEVYSYTFESSLGGSWNLDKLWFVGLLQADAQDNKEIINCAVAAAGSPLSKIIDSNTPATQVVSSGADLVKTYTLANLTDEAQTYTVVLSTTSRTPTDWSAQFTSGATKLVASGPQPVSGQVVVPAQGTAELSLTLTLGATLGLGDAQMLAQLQGTPMITRSRTVSGISREITHLLLESRATHSLRPYLVNTAGADAVTLDPRDYVAHADGLTDVNLVIWNKGPWDGLSAEEIKVIKRIPNVNTFICGDNYIGGMSASDLSYFGLQWIGWNLEAQGTTGTVWLAGQQGDVITGALGGNIEGRLMFYYLDMVKILDTAQVFPILHYQNSGLRRMGASIYPISAQDALVGVRSTRNNVRTVLLSLSAYVIWQERNRQALVKNILAWLAP